MKGVLEAYVNVSVLLLSLGVLKAFMKVSLRKTLHILSGPAVLIPLVGYQFSLFSAILAAMIPLSASLMFLLAYWLEFKPILRMIERDGASQVAGVVEYGVLWSLWPFFELHCKEDLVIPALINLTLGDGFAGCAKYFTHSNQKTKLGSLLYVLFSASGMVLYGYSIGFSVALSLAGAIAEYFAARHDNVVIFALCVACCYVKSKVERK